MQKQEMNVIEWGKCHKKGLVITGIGISVGITLAVLLRNQNSIAEKFISSHSTGIVLPGKVTAESAPRVIIENKPEIKRAPHLVMKHLRNLPQGQKASKKQIELAKENGINLLPSQTFVSQHKRGRIAA